MSRSTLTLRSSMPIFTMLQAKKACAMDSTYLASLSVIVSECLHGNHGRALTELRLTTETPDTV